MNPGVFEVLPQQIDELVRTVGFQRAHDAGVEGRCLSAHDCMWRSPYAVILLTRVLEGTPEAITEAHTRGSELLDDVLLAEERDGKLLDGYLLIALSSQPSDGLRLACEQVDQDTAICRKHVLWPDAGGDWRGRLYRVTVFGLPITSGESGPPATVELPVEAALALELYAKTGSVEKTVVSIDNQEQPDNEST